MIWNMLISIPNSFKVEVDHVLDDAKNLFQARVSPILKMKDVGTCY